MKTTITFAAIKDALLSEAWEGTSYQTQRGITLFPLTSLAYYLEIGLAADGETVVLASDGDCEETEFLEAVAVCDAVDARWLDRVVECVADACPSVDRESLRGYIDYDDLLSGALMLYDIAEYGVKLSEEAEAEICSILEEYDTKCADEYAQAALEDDPDFLEICKDFMERIRDAACWEDLSPSRV